MFKIHSQIPNRDIYIITKSPFEQFSNSKIKIKETAEETKTLTENTTSIIGLDEILGTSITRYIDQVFNRGRHNNFYIYNLSQSSFNLPKRTIRNISNKTILFNQTLKGTENMYRDVGG